MTEMTHFISIKGHWAGQYEVTYSGTWARAEAMVGGNLFAEETRDVLLQCSRFSKQRRM